MPFAPFDDVLVLDEGKRVIGSATARGQVAQRAALEEPLAERQQLPDGSTLVSVPAAGIEPSRVFARAVVHEVRSPLNALALYLEVARSRVGTQSQGERLSAQAALDKAAAQVGRVDDVLRTFLELWAPTPGGESDLAALTRAAGRLASHLASRRRAALSVEVEPGELRVAVPGRALADALFTLFDDALVDGAAAANAEAGARVQLTLRGREGVWLEVKVTGTAPIAWLHAWRAFAGLGARVEREPDRFVAIFERMGD